VIDGLVQRDIRKFKGSRESALFFHRIKPLAIHFLFFTFFIYMVLPLPISPELILIPMAIISGICISLSIKSYKKYL